MFNRFLFSGNVRVLALSALALVLDTPITCQRVKRQEYVAAWGKEPTVKGVRVWSVWFERGGRVWRYDAMTLDGVLWITLDTVRIAGAFAPVFKAQETKNVKSTSRGTVGNSKSAEHVRRFVPAGQTDQRVHESSRTARGRKRAQDAGTCSKAGAKSRGGVGGAK